MAVSGVPGQPTPSDPSDGASQLADLERQLRELIAANMSATTQMIVQQGMRLPVAATIPYAGASAPTGWLLCDGAAVSRTTYADLFAAISTTYGAGDGSTTFNVPNLKGRVPVGRDAAQGEFDTLGETGGAKTHTLSESEMPSHTHTQNSHSHGNSAVGYSIGAGSGGFQTTGSQTVSWNTNSTTATNQNTGGNGAHNNLQPYMALNYIIKHFLA